MCYYIVWIKTAHWLIWIILLSSLSMGIIFGIFVLSTKKIGFILNGIWLGIIVALLFYNGFLFIFPTEPLDIILYITLSVSGLIFGACVFKIIE